MLQHTHMSANEIMLDESKKKTPTDWITAVISAN